MIRNPLKSFIEKKFDNLLPTDIQCILPEEERKCQKYHILGMKIWYLAHVSFVRVTCSHSLFIFLSTWCIKMHRFSFRCPKNMFKGKLLKLIFWFRPLSYFKQCHFLTLKPILSQIVADYAQMIVLTMTFTFIQKSRNRKTNWERVTCTLIFASKYISIYTF